MIREVSTVEVLGFDPDDPNSLSEGQIRSLYMEERARLLHGSFQIESTPESGTRSASGSPAGSRAN